MVYATILAGGQGSRLKKAVIPKQYLLLGDKPIFIHTLEHFLKNDRVDKIVIVCASDYLKHVNDEVIRYVGKTDKVSVTEGGLTRTDSLIKGLYYIKDNFGINQDDIVITHDAVRPFINDKIINDNIDGAMEYGAATTAVSAIDTIGESPDGICLNNIPIRSHLWQLQSPQTFNLKRMIEIYSELTDKEKETLTDASKPFITKNEQVKLVDGAFDNFKITTDHDWDLAQMMIK